MHPIMEQDTPSSLTTFNVSMDGVRISVQEIDKVLHATAHDNSTGEYLDAISLTFPPPPPTSTFTPTLVTCSNHQPSDPFSFSLRKRKRSIGSASSITIDSDSIITTTTPTTTTSTSSSTTTTSNGNISPSNTEQQLSIHNPYTPFIINMSELTPLSSNTTSSSSSQCLTVTQISDHQHISGGVNMDVDSPTPIQSNSSSSLITAKPVKKRAKSIDTTNSHFSLLAATAASAAMSCIAPPPPPQATVSSTTLGKSISVLPATTNTNTTSTGHPIQPPSSSFDHLPNTSISSTAAFNTTPPFPPSPIHSPSHVDVPTGTLLFCDTPPGSRSVSPNPNHPNTTNVPFRAAPMTPIDEPAYTVSNTPYIASNLSFSSLAINHQQPSTIPALARINNLSHWVTQLDGLPEPFIHYAIFQVLRRCNVSTLQFVHGIVAPALKRDFLCLLPYEIASNILQRLDYVSLCRSARVSHRWRTLIDSDMHLWRTLGASDGFWPLDKGYLQPGSMLRIRNLYDIARIQSARQVPISRIDADLLPFLDPTAVARVLAGEHHIDPRDVVVSQMDHPFKSMYTRGRQLQNAWMHKDPKMVSFLGHGSAVVTCLQFDEDKVVSGSDDQTICVYDIRTGALRMRLEGHEGGVWALQYIGHTLVSGSTDRTVRVWDLRTGRTTHVFHGHTSTVRCLQLLLPIAEPGMPPPTGTVHLGTPYTGGYLSSSTYLGYTPTPKLKEPLIVTGSRDTHLRVWRLPEPNDAPWPPVDHNKCPPPPRTIPGMIRRSNAFASNSTYTPNASVPDLFGIVVDEDQNHPNEDTVAAGNAHPESQQDLEEDDLDMDQEPVGGMHTVASHPGIGSSSSSVLSKNPYFRHVLSGHGASVRALAGHGHIVCSGSYDCTVRVWDVVAGTCMWQLSGHTNKVYSIVYDGMGRCWSGAMDSQVRCWDVHTGVCLNVLEGHSSLVGLLEISPKSLISAAADSTLRVWNTADHSLVHSLQAHTNAITCFHYDAHKIVSGSEGAIKLWDPRSGKVVRDLVTGVTSVWRLQVNERYCVAAVNREARTEFLVLDFDASVV